MLKDRYTSMVLEAAPHIPREIVFRKELCLACGRKKQWLTEFRKLPPIRDNRIICPMPAPKSCHEVGGFRTGTGKYSFSLLS